MTLLPMSPRIERDPRENEVAAAASRLTKPTKKKGSVYELEIGARLFCPRAAELEDKKKVSEQQLSQQ
ncbi:unnamed protein product [Brassica rapa subsp. trilocularis]